ncbi:MAG: hypothetical protein WCA35_13250, partial [Kovacikia sp.]
GANNDDVILLIINNHACSPLIRPMPFVIDRALFVIRHGVLVTELVLQTLNFATGGFGSEAPKQGFHPFTPFKTCVLIY